MREMLSAFQRVGGFGVSAGRIGAVTDPGADTVSSYIVHWGDGTSDTYNSGGNVTHTYATPGNYTIGVDLTGPALRWPGPGSAPARSQTNCPEPSTPSRSEAA